MGKRLPSMALYCASVLQNGGFSTHWWNRLPIDPSNPRLPQSAKVKTRDLQVFKKFHNFPLVCFSNFVSPVEQIQEEEFDCSVSHLPLGWVLPLGVVGNWSALQGGTTCGRPAGGPRENGEKMKRKWRGNRERTRNWR